MIYGKVYVLIVCIMGGVVLKRLFLLLTGLIMILSAPIAFAEEDAVIREWEEKYGDQRLWDYLINAAFAEQESWRYAFLVFRVLWLFC